MDHNKPASISSPKEPSAHFNLDKSLPSQDQKVSLSSPSAREEKNKHSMGLRFFDTLRKPLSDFIANNQIQIQLQTALTAACEQGDEKEVTRLLKLDAMPGVSDVQGKQPFGAAVWGMNFKVINVLIQHMGGSPMTWEQCEIHNKEHYKEVFMVEKFLPKEILDVRDLLKKVQLSAFVHTSLLEIVCGCVNLSIESGYNYERLGYRLAFNKERLHLIISRIEDHYSALRKEIQEALLAASNVEPTPYRMFGSFIFS